MILGKFGGLTVARDYQAECHTPEYHIGIDLIKPFRNPISSDPQNVRRSSRNRRS